MVNFGSCRFENISTGFAPTCMIAWPHLNKHQIFSIFSPIKGFHQNSLKANVWQLCWDDAKYLHMWFKRSQTCSFFQFSCVTNAEGSFCAAVGQSILLRPLKPRCVKTACCTWIASEIGKCESGIWKRYQRHGLMHLDSFTCCTIYPQFERVKMNRFFKRFTQF